jgi:hypothetical protein
MQGGLLVHHPLRMAQRQARLGHVQPVGEFHMGDAAVRQSLDRPELPSRVHSEPSGHLSGNMTERIGGQAIVGAGVPRTSDLTKEQNERIREIVKEYMRAQKEAGEPSSQKMLAPRIGLVQSALSRFLDGGTGMTWGTLKRLSTVLGRPVWDVLGEEPPELEGVTAGQGGYQDRRDRRYPGTHPLVRRRFFALPAAGRGRAWSRRSLAAALRSAGSSPVRAASRSGVGCAEAFLEDEVLCALGEALGDHLGVECVGEDLGPVLEGPIGGDAGGASKVVALGDNLEGELGLGGVHGEDGEVVDDEQLGAHVAA